MPSNNGKGSVTRPTDAMLYGLGIDRMFPDAVYKVPGTECPNCGDYPVRYSANKGFHCITCNWSAAQ